MPHLKVENEWMEWKKESTKHGLSNRKHQNKRNLPIIFRGAPPHVSEGSAAPLLCANVYESVENEISNTLICWCQHSSIELAFTLKLSHYSVRTFSTRVNAKWPRSSLHQSCWTPDEKVQQAYHIRVVTYHIRSASISWTFFVFSLISFHGHRTNNVPITGSS